jgi:predicted nucleic acid-binding protein
VIVDTSGMLAFLDRKEPDHDAVSAVIDDAPGPFVVSELVLAELDYLVATSQGSMPSSPC